MLLENKKQARLEMHYQFDQQDIQKGIESSFTNENDNVTINETTNATK